MSLPVGQYIKISKPEPVRESDFILEKEPVSRATVQEISPDVEVPFKSGDTIFFYTDRHIEFRKEYFLGIEMCLLFC